MNLFSYFYRFVVKSPIHGGNGRILVGVYTVDQPILSPADLQIMIHNLSGQCETDPSLMDLTAFTMLGQFEVPDQEHLNG